MYTRSSFSTCSLAQLSNQNKTHSQQSQGSSDKEEQGVYTVLCKDCSKFMLPNSAAMFLFILPNTNSVKKKKTWQSVYLVNIYGQQWTLSRFQQFQNSSNVYNNKNRLVKERLEIIKYAVN